MRHSDITPVGINLRSSVLTGSVTTTEIDVSDVEVEPYENGFADSPFSEISFD